MKNLKLLLMTLLALVGVSSSVWAKPSGTVEKHATQKECDEVDPGDVDSFE